MTRADIVNELHFQLAESRSAIERTIAALRGAERAAEGDLVRDALIQCIREAEYIRKRATNISKFCGVRGV